MSRNNYKGKGKGKGKAKPNFAKSNSKPERDELQKGNRDNDPNWYFTSSELAEQTSQLSFQNLLGFGSLNGYQVPSIMRIDTVMNPGVTYNVLPSGRMSAPIFDIGDAALQDNPDILPGKAGVNMMAAKLYTLLSSFTGRTASYAPQDVAMMILGISSICEVSEHIRRIFGIGLTYNFRNRMLPLHLIDTMQCDSADFARNLSIYRTRFNVAMARINQIPLLENIAFIKKSRDVYQNIYMDDPTNMSQLFYYQPRYAFFLDEKGDSDGSILRAVHLVPRNASTATMGDLLSTLEKQITYILESSTLNYIYADLLNMANKLSVPTWKFDYLAENYVVMPVYNANALLQLHNLTVTGDPGDADSTWTPDHPTGSGWDDSKHVPGQALDHIPYVTGGASIFCDADKNDIVYNPVFDGVKYYLRKGFVDMPTDSPSIEDRIEAMRYMTLWSGLCVDNQTIGAAGDNYTLAPALPDHYAAMVHVFTNWDDKATWAANRKGRIITNVCDSVPAMEVWDNVGYLSQFEHAFPIIKHTGVGYFGHVYGTLQYYTEVDYAYLKRINDIMSVGLFDFRA